MDKKTFTKKITNLYNRQKDINELLKISYIKYELVMEKLLEMRSGKDPEKDLEFLETKISEIEKLIINAVLKIGVSEISESNSNEFLKELVKTQDKKIKALEKTINNLIKNMGGN